jgi:hypothetical protein
VNLLVRDAPAASRLPAAAQTADTTLQAQRAVRRVRQPESSTALIRRATKGTPGTSGGRPDRLRRGWRVRGGSALCPPPTQARWGGGGGWGVDENQGWQGRSVSLRSATRHPERPRSGQDARVTPRPGPGPGPPGSAGSPLRLSGLRTSRTGFCVPQGAAKAARAARRAAGRGPVRSTLPFAPGNNAMMDGTGGGRVCVSSGRPRDKIRAADRPGGPGRRAPFARLARPPTSRAT